jgi:hypothetical protein
MRRTLARVARGVAGFSVTETATMMTALSLLTATAAPNIQEYLEMARETKARGDVRVLVVSLTRMLNDVGSIAARAGRATLLVGPGRAPEAVSTDLLHWSASDPPPVQALADHLLTNDAGYPDGRWRGPYFEGLSPDPWGCRYAANTGMLGNRDGLMTIVVSAGPNCIVETPFRMTRLVPAGDDVVGIVSTGH